MKKLLKLIVPLVEVILFALVVLMAVFFIPSMDRKVADWFQRPLKPLNEQKDVLMINVDDASIESIGVWPFSRDVYAGMMDALKDFVGKVKTLSENAETNVTFLISANKDELPDNMGVEMTVL
jgi:adenylate cyclase